MMLFYFRQSNKTQTRNLSTRIDMHCKTKLNAFSGWNSLFLKAMCNCVQKATKTVPRKCFILFKQSYSQHILFLVFLEFLTHSVILFLLTSFLFLYLHAFVSCTLLSLYTNVLLMHLCPCSLCLYTLNLILDYFPSEVDLV